MDLVAMANHNVFFQLLYFETVLLTCCFLHKIVLLFTLIDIQNLRKINQNLVL